MRRLLKKYAGMIYIAVMTAVMAVFLVFTDEAGEAFEALRSLDARWAAAAGGCIVIYLFLRMATMKYYLHRNGFRVSWGDVLAASGAGQFYSAITPSASGGQPMQVLTLRKRGVPVSLGTSCMSAKFIGFQSAFLLVGLVLWIRNRELVNAQLYGFRWLVAVGYAVNAGLMILVGLTALQGRIVGSLVNGTVRIGVKLRLVRKPEETVEKLNGMLSEYREALISLVRRPMDALAVFGLSVLQVIAYMSVVICVYKAFGLGGVTADGLMTMQTLLFIAAAFIPVPGAAGAQESGFCVFFRGLFPESDLIAAMLCWRFFTYYLLMFAGLVMMAAGSRKSEGLGEE